MNSTVINIKTDAKIKKEAQMIASDLGLTLSGAINGFLKQLVRNKTILLTLDESPTKYLLDSIKESKNQRKNGSYHSFKNNDDALEFIKKQ